jgi:chemotaxis protein MotB
MMRRRRKEKHVNHERWLVSYADFITLLFAFFVVLFASSHVDKHKVERFSAAVRTAFEDMGLFQVGSQAVAVSEKGTYPQNSQQVVEPIRPTSSYLDQKLAKVRNELVLKVESEGFQNKVRINTDRRGLVVSLAEAAFFDSGSADLRDDSLRLLGSVAQVLQEVPNKIRIEGHTDNVPIHNERFPSNWELSTTRATNVIAFLLKHYAFQPQLLSPAGYSEYHPVAANDTAEGRALNRRVDLVVLNQAAAQDEP